MSLYEATLTFLDGKVETIILEEDQTEKFVEQIVEGKYFIDPKRKVVFWLPPGTLRYMTVTPSHEKESQSCQRNQALDQESQLKS